ncbi:hypothetical protein B0T16DRAFT_455450 [Cercophora newfieldiana]|uniref:Uncharacterized protein n=1 Tax=Cercophora newfieldiana TaxID=92897 RepID=A0AA39YJG5_9PEZI|nr:hypothetical protein B0T16DRAFT_455450 [Cercophora newfieldiana]
MHPTEQQNSNNGNGQNGGRVNKRRGKGRGNRSQRRNRRNRGARGGRSTPLPRRGSDMSLGRDPDLLGEVAPLPMSLPSTGGVIPDGKATYTLIPANVMSAEVLSTAQIVYIRVPLVGSNGFPINATAHTLAPFILSPVMHGNQQQQMPSEPVLSDSGSSNPERMHTDSDSPPMTNFSPRDEEMPSPRQVVVNHNAKTPDEYHVRL